MVCLYSQMRGSIFLQNDLIDLRTPAESHYGVVFLSSQRGPEKGGRQRHLLGEIHFPPFRQRWVHTATKTDKKNVLVSSKNLRGVLDQIWTRPEGFIAFSTVRWSQKIQIRETKQACSGGGGEPIEIMLIKMNRCLWKRLVLTHLYGRRRPAIPLDSCRSLEPRRFPRSCSPGDRWLHRGDEPQRQAY